MPPMKTIRSRSIPEWQRFLRALKDDASDVRKNAKGASWSKPNWPLQANGELVSALDGNWGLVEKVIEKKVRDKAVGNGARGLRTPTSTRRRAIPCAPS